MSLLTNSIDPPVLDWELYDVRYKQDVRQLEREYVEKVVRHYKLLHALLITLKGRVRSGMAYYIRGEQNIQMSLEQLILYIEYELKRIEEQGLVDVGMMRLGNVLWSYYSHKLKNS